MLFAGVSFNSVQALVFSKFWTQTFSGFTFYTLYISNYKTIEMYLNASLGNCEIWFLPKSKERKYSNPSTESVVNFVNSQPFKLSLFKLFNFVNGLPETWSNFYQILEKSGRMKPRVGFLDSETLLTAEDFWSKGL